MGSACPEPGGSGTCSGLADNVRRAEAWVQAQMAGNDSSHDWWHVHRVRRLAARLAREEGLPPAAQQCAELAALLHDVADWKYCPDPTAADAALRDFVSGGGGSGAGGGEGGGGGQGQGHGGLSLAPAQQALILGVIAGLGFKDGLPSASDGGQPGAAAGGAAAAAAAPETAAAEAGSAAAAAGGEAGAPTEFAAVLGVVQDADRLDAIGAIGVARCLTFGGQRGRVLHDPGVKPREGLTREAYMDAAAQQTTLNHFHEKLFKLKGLMRTGAGQRLAEERHAFMEEFLGRLLREWDGEA